MKETIKKLFRWLSVKHESGGLQISDSALQYVSITAGAQTVAVKIPPGILRDGKIILRDELVEFLKKLHDMIDPGHVESPISVVVCLPASSVFTQSFTVPNLGEERLQDAALLNAKMLSPIPYENAYMHWQLLRATPEQFELLGAFAERHVVDDLRLALEEAHFVASAFEFPSLAVTRLLESSAQNKTTSSLMLNISGDGIDIAIVKSGGLYFDYFRSWSSIQGDAREISRTLFEEAIVQEIQKVLNFALGRFKEMPQQVYLLTPMLEEDIKQIITEHFKIIVTQFSVDGWNLDSQWYPALGAAVRGAGDRSRDMSISLAPVASAELFIQEQTISFIELWRNIIVGTLIFFALFLGVVANRLDGEAKAFKDSFGSLGQHPLTELKQLETQAAEFNTLVQVARDARVPSASWHILLSSIMKEASSRNVAIDRFEASTSGAGSFTLSARVQDGSYETVSEFERALKTVPGMSNVEVPLRFIGKLDDGAIRFTVTFVFLDPSAQK